MKKETGAPDSDFAWDETQEETIKSEEMTRSIRKRIQVTLDEAPSDATARIFIRKVKNGYKGLLRIYSQQRRFVGGAMEKSLSVLLEDLFTDVQKQIKDWKAKRFSNSTN